MPNRFHKTYVGHNVHAITANPDDVATGYADIAARNADASFQVTANINKAVRVASPDIEIFVLLSVGPTVWSTGIFGSAFDTLAEVLANGNTTGGTDIVISAGDNITGLTQLNVDNLRLDGNTLSTTNTNGNLLLSPDGLGQVDFDASVLINITQLTVDELRFDGDKITTITTNADLKIRPDVTVRVDFEASTIIAIGQLNVDNLRMDGNTLSSLTGDIFLNPAEGVEVLTSEFSVINSAGEAAIVITALGTDVDAIIRLELVDGTPTFVMGVDASDGNKFKIGTTSIETDTRLTIDNAGLFGFNLNNPTKVGHFMGTSGGTAEVLISTDTNAAGQTATLAFTIPNGTPRSGMRGTTRAGDVSDLVLFAQSGASTEFDAVTILGASGFVGVGVSPTDKLHVNGSIRISSAIGAVLKIGAQNGTNEGAEIDWDGAGSNDNWTQDLFFQKMRFFTSSTNANIVEFMNGGSGTMGLTVEDKISLGSLDVPINTLDVRGTTGFELTESAVNVNSGSETIIGITDTAAVRTVTLRTVDTVLRRLYIIKDQSFNAGTNKISIVTEGSAKIENDSAGVDIIVDGGKLVVYCNGTDWFSW